MKTWAIRILEFPAFEHVVGRDLWLVVRPMRICVNGKLYTVPTGYRTDGASVPRIPFVYSRYGNTAHIPALWHDWIYDGCLGEEFTRKDADEMFLAMMQMLNDPTGHLRRKMMYRAVRAFGWIGWSRDTSWKCPCKRELDNLNLYTTD